MWVGTTWPEKGSSETPERRQIDGWEEEQFFRQERPVRDQRPVREAVHGQEEPADYRQRITQEVQVRTAITV